MFKTFAKYVFLNVMSMLGLSLYILVDTYFIANEIGRQALAALNIILPLFYLVTGVGILLGTGSSCAYSICRGANNDSEANQSLTSGFLLAIIVSLVFTFLSFFYLREILLLLGADNEVFQDAREYFYIFSFFAWSLILSNFFACAVRNDENPKLATASMLLASFLNILLDYLFICIFKWGMFGAALATGIASLSGLAVLLLHILCKKNKFYFEFTGFKAIRFLKIISLGTAAFINEFSAGIVMAAFNLTIHTLAGNVGIAAYGIIANTALVAIAVFNGIASGAQPLFSYLHGAQKKQELKAVAKYAFITVFVTGLTVYALVCLNKTDIIALFNKENNPKLAEIASHGINMYFLSFIFLGLNVAAISYFASIEQPIKALSVSLLRGCVIVIPVLILFSGLWGMLGVWLSQPFAEMLTLLFVLTSFKKSLK
ncbi:MAG: MATE family efflux transporter [Candidatus Riflebacteria bacterium]|nr:MATE family efflux transporter [Candidatus Riflebacteria bacterium]